jgi:small subunit ribosomal protein S7
MRGKQAPKRELTPDTKYGNVMVAKLINYIMRAGKKSVAQAVVYNAFDYIKEQTQKDPVEIFDTAMKNVQPTVEVKSKRVGGANYQIPIQVRGERRLSLGLRWLIGAANAKKGRGMALKLGAEIISAANNEGDAVKKKMDVHRMADANRAFAHFAR